jgi:predicted protein tyrosine phosphatase
MSQKHLYTFKTMQFFVTDRQSIQKGIVVRTPYIVISIYDPDKPRPGIPRRTGMKGVFYVAFHDAEPDDEMSLPPNIVLMSLRQAKDIWAFVRKHQAEVGTVVCHCEQGMSRSPAVAVALAEAFGSSTQKIESNSNPNRYVYGLMRKAIEEDC